MFSVSHIMLPPITDDHPSDLRMTGVNLAAVIGASVGAVVFVAIVIAVVIYRFFCKRGRTDSAPPDPALPASVITTNDEVKVQPGNFARPPQYHGVQVQPGSVGPPPPYQTKA